MSDDLNEILDGRIRRIVGEMLGASEARPVAAPVVVDEVTRETVNQYLLISHKPYLTKKEAAVYLDCSERSIGEWSARAVDDNPFPASSAGSEPRYKRELIDEWAEREAQRKRLKLAS